MRGSLVLLVEKQNSYSETRVRGRHDVEEEPKKAGGSLSRTPGSLLVALLAQVVVLYVGPDSLGHFRG